MKARRRPLKKQYSLEEDIKLFVKAMDEHTVFKPTRKTKTHRTVSDVKTLGIRARKKADEWSANTELMMIAEKVLFGIMFLAIVLMFVSACVCVAGGTV